MTIKTDFIDKLLKITPMTPYGPVLNLNNENEIGAIKQSYWADTDEGINGTEYIWDPFIEFDETNRITNVNYDALDGFAKVSAPVQKEITTLILNYMAQPDDAYVKLPVKKLVLKQDNYDDDLFENDVYLTAEKVPSKGRIHMKFATAKKGELPDNATFDTDDAGRLMNADRYIRRHRVNKVNHNIINDEDKMFTPQTREFME